MDQKTTDVKSPPDSFSSQITCKILLYINNPAQYDKAKTYNKLKYLTIFVFIIGFHSPFSIV